MNLVGDHFFADTGLAHNQQRRVNRRDPRCHFNDPLHRRTFRNQVFHLQLLQANLLQFGNIALIQFNRGFQLTLQLLQIGHVTHVDNDLHQIAIFVKHRCAGRHDLVAFTRPGQNIHQQSHCFFLFQGCNGGRFIVPFAVNQVMRRFADDLGPRETADFFPGRVHADHCAGTVGYIKAIVRTLKDCIQFLDRRV